MEMNDWLDRISDRINELRAQGKNVSDRSVSMAATGSPDTIRNWRRAAETGKQSSATTAKLALVAEALGVTPDWIMWGYEDANDRRNQTISEIVNLLRRLEPAELEILRAAAQGIHDQHRAED